MRIITFEDKDAVALLDRLKLAKLEGQRVDWKQRIQEGQIDGVLSDMHRAFHYEVTRWLQDQGASCVR